MIPMALTERDGLLHQIVFPAMVVVGALLLLAALLTHATLRARARRQARKFAMPAAAPPLDVPAVPSPTAPAAAAPLPADPPVPATTVLEVPSVSPSDLGLSDTHYLLQLGRQRSARRARAEQALHSSLTPGEWLLQTDTALGGHNLDLFLIGRRGIFLVALANDDAHASWLLEDMREPAGRLRWEMPTYQGAITRLVLVTSEHAATTVTEDGETRSDAMIADDQHLVDAVMSVPASGLAAQDIAVLARDIAPSASIVAPPR